ncbi:hypothetical protein CsatB_028410 [Cannabis sativa]
MSSPLDPLPNYPLHRFTMLLRRLHQCNWLEDLRYSHPNHRYRSSISSLQEHVSLTLQYIQYHRVLPLARRARSPRLNCELFHRRHYQLHRVFQGHLNNLRMLFIVLHEDLRLVRRFVFQQQHLARYRACIEILYCYTNVL